MVAVCWGLCLINNRARSKLSVLARKIKTLVATQMLLLVIIDSPGFYLQAGIALGELRSIGDLYDFNSIATLFLIGLVSVTPTLVTKNKSA